MNSLRRKHWKWLTQNFTTKHREKNENTVMLLLLNRLLWDVMVFCAFEKIRGLMSAQERHWEQQLVPKIKWQKLVTWLLIYQWITVHWNWPYHMDWETAESAFTHSHSVLRFCSRTLIQRQSWSQMISVVRAGNGNSTASLLMERYDLASKQRLMCMGTLCISDPLSLLAFSICQWPGNAG